MMNRYICTLHVYCTYTAWRWWRTLAGAAGGADCFFGTESPSLAERECHISRKCGWGTVIWHAVLWLRSRNSRLTGVEYGIAEWCGIWPEWRKSMSVPKAAHHQHHPKIQHKIKKQHITTHKNKSQNQNSKIPNTNNKRQIANYKWQKQKRGNFTWKNSQTKNSLPT